MTFNPLLLDARLLAASEDRIFRILALSGRSDGTDYDTENQLVTVSRAVEGYSYA